MNTIFEFSNGVQVNLDSWTDVEINDIKMHLNRNGEFHTCKSASFKFHMESIENYSGPFRRDEELIEMFRTITVDRIVVISDEGNYRFNKPVFSSFANDGEELRLTIGDYYANQ